MAVSALHRPAVPTIAALVSIASALLVTPSAHAEPLADLTTPASTTTIAAVQGTGATSPLVGTTVTVRGVVTANYPTGGFNGFYLQTPGSGGAAHAAGTASDAVFVYTGTNAVTLGSCYDVTGKVAEYSGLTELTSPTVSLVASGCAAIRPIALSSVPSDPDKEAMEGMLVRPTGTWTITDNYQLNQYGQVGITPGDRPLYTATDVVAPGPDALAYEQHNLAQTITLDDGSSWNYLTNKTAQRSPLPYLSQATPMRTGSHLWFSTNVVLDYHFQWNFQPTGQVIGTTTNVPVTSQNDRPAGPPAVGGDLKLASFNVLNYFTDLGKDEAGCTAYTDMNGVPVETKNCQVRGAYSAQAFADQQAKVVAAINGLGADIVGLEEIENSAGISYLPGQDRDKALTQLVDALNAAGGHWAKVPSPLVTGAGSEDVIRTAFIYRPATVAPLDDSLIDLDPAFANARYPLGQRFKAVRSGVQFVVVDNHFKSKGSGVDDGTGQGLSEPSREAQASQLVHWVEQVWPSKPVFLMGDFNAYSMETPVHTITDAGYTDLARKLAPGQTTYQYAGRSGSLDHVFANAKARALVSGAAVWGINAQESVAMQYSRRAYNIVDFYTRQPYAASDHNPVLVGITVDRHGHGRGGARW